MIGKQGHPNITSATMIQIIQANEALKKVYGEVKHSFSAREGSHELEREETSRRGKVGCSRNRHIKTGVWNKLIGGRKQAVRQLSLSLPFDVRLPESHPIWMVTSGVH